MNESKRPQVVAMIAAGMTVLEVAFELRISPQAVYQHLKAAGLKPPTKR